MRVGFALIAVLFCLVPAKIFAEQSETTVTKMRVVAEPGNVADTKFNKGGRGSVAYLYRIAHNPVSNREYAQFLTAVDPAGVKGLYVKEMAIERKGQKGTYVYSAVKGKEDSPVTSVSYINAAEYCNWLSGGNVYEVIDEQVTRRAPANVRGAEVFFIPTQNELYKGKYYQGDGKYQYTRSPVAEMVATRHRAWHRIAFGNTNSPEDFIYCNNYTNNVTGKSEDNIRNTSVGFRVASRPLIHLVHQLEARHNSFTDLPSGVNVTTRSALTGNADLDWKILDYWGKEFESGKQQLDLKKGLSKLTLGSRKYPRGYFRITGSISRQNEVVDRFDVPFVVMPNYPFKPEPDSPFGVCGHMDRMYNMWGRVSPEAYEDLLLNAGASWMRTDYPWKNITGSFVEKGISILSFFPFFYSYKRYDSPYESDNVQSKWSKLNIPPELYGYADQVEKLIKENPHVKHWEVGNEPHGWKVSPGDYAQQVKTAYKVAKATDPQTYVVMGDSEHLHKSLVRVYHADNYADAVAIHTYGFFRPSEKNYYEGVVSRVLELRKSLAANGDKNKPVWTTELGGCGYWKHIFPGKTEEERFRYQALDVPKKLAGSLGLGVDKVFYYELIATEVGGTEGEFGLVGSDLMPKPAYVSYRVTSEQLHGREFAGWLDLGREKLTGLEFSGKENNCYLLWREDVPPTLERRGRVVWPMVEISAPETITIKSAGDVLITDVMGVSRELKAENGVVKIPVNEYPVFVQGSLEVKHKDIVNLDNVKPNPITDKNKVVLQILPPLDQMVGYNDLHNMQLQARMKLTREKDQTFTVRMYNLSKEDISGKLYLEPPQSNSDLGWIVKNSYDDITIKAESTKTAEFTVYIPKRPYIGEAPYILKAVFESGGEQYSSDILVQQVINRDVMKKDSVVGKLGFFDGEVFRKNYALIHKKLKGVEDSYSKSDGTNLYVVKWNNPANKFLEFEVTHHPEISDNPGRKTVVLGFKASGTSSVKKVSLRLVDKDGEIFQFSGSGKLSDGNLNDIKFDITEGKQTGSWGGKKNGKFDMPLRLRSIVIDFSSNKGEVSITAPSLVINK